MESILLSSAKGMVEVCGIVEPLQPTQQQFYSAFALLGRLKSFLVSQAFPMVIRVAKILSNNDYE